MFKDDYKNSFKDINPKESLKNKVKKEMFLENEKIKNKNMFSNRKFVYGISLALISLVLIKTYVPKNNEVDFSTSDVMEKQENARVDSTEQETSEEANMNNMVTESLDTFYLSEEEKNIDFSKIDGNIGSNYLGLDFEEETENKYLTYEEYISYLGKEIFPKYIPEGLILEELDEMEILNIFYKNGEVAYDPFTLNYLDYSEKTSKSINLTVSKINYLSDFNSSVHYSGELKEEIINNTKVYLGYDILLGTKFNTEEEIIEMNKNDEYSLYIARFEKDGVYYTLSSCFIGKEEFLKVLKSLI